MANRVLINKQILQDSIDAIRAKKGTTDSIVVADMPTEIASIEGGGSGIADSTKTLVGAISGVTPTDETTLNNAIASAYADTPSEQKWNGTRSTADGGTIKDGVAFLQSVKGSTIKFNQLGQPKDSSTESVGITPTKTTTGYVLNGTATADAWIGLANIPVLSGHKYFIKTCPSGGSTTTYYVFAGSNDVGSGAFWTASADGNRVVSAVIKSGQTITNLLFEVMFFDLTAMGIDSLTTADAVAQYFGYSSIADLPYMPTQTETKLLNFTHNSISSKSRNLWDNDAKFKVADVVMNYDANKAIFLKAGNYAVSWEVTGATSWRLSCAFFDANGNKDLTRGTLTSGYASTNICFWNSNGTNKFGYFSLSQDSYVMLGLTFGDVSASTIVSSVQVEKGNTATDYAPYFTDTLSLNVPTSVFPNGMNGVGTAFDEWKPSEGKAIKRIGKIVINGTSDIKQETGSTGNGVGLFTLRVADSTTIANPNIGAICAKLPSISQGSLYSASLPIGINLWTRGKMLAFRISSDITSVADAKTWLSSNPLEVYYILGADAETTTDKAKAFYKVANGGTESVSGGTDSTPIKADIGYREATATELINALNG